MPNRSSWGASAPLMPEPGGPQGPVRFPEPGPAPVGPAVPVPDQTPVPSPADPGPAPVGPAV